MVFTCVEACTGHRVKVWMTRYWDVPKVVKYRCGSIDYINHFNVINRYYYP